MTGTRFRPVVDDAPNLNAVLGWPADARPRFDLDIEIVGQSAEACDGHCGVGRAVGTSLERDYFIMKHILRS